MRGATVSVGNGASLQCDAIIAPVGGLRIDMAGSGTIDSLTLAEGGALYLENVQGSPAGQTIPLTVTTLTNPELLRTWSLYVNGVLTSGYHLQWDSATGRLILVRGGTIIFLK